MKVTRRSVGAWLLGCLCLPKATQSAGVDLARWDDRTCYVRWIKAGQIVVCEGKTVEIHNEITLNGKAVAEFVPRCPNGLEGEKGLPGCEWNAMTDEQRSEACDGTTFMPPDGKRLPEWQRWSHLLGRGVGVP